MNIPDIIILGITQGITEFLPVSSDGHLIAVRLFFAIPDTDGLAIDAFLHLGTLLAVLTYYRRVWYGVLRGLFIRDDEGVDKRELLGKLLIATIPAAIIGYVGQDIVATTLRSANATAAGLAATAVILLSGDALFRRSTPKQRASLTDALMIGLAQSIALLPGVSRSGTTIATARARGLSRSQAVHFSFLMSVPIIAGAGASMLLGLIHEQLLSPLILLTGFVTSFVAGLAAIHFLIHLAEKISFVPFAIYLFSMAAVLIIWF